MEIFFIRHGSTAGNQEHRYVGSTDEPLTSESQKILAEQKDYYPRPDCVFASPLHRCVQTAEALYPEIPLRTVPEMKELDFGEFEYKNYEELKNDGRYQAWIDSGGRLPFPGGESREDFCKRCCSAFENACREASDGGFQKAAFVVHGGTIMAVLDRFSSPHQDYFDWQVKNAEGFSCELQWPDEGEDHECLSLSLTNIRPLPLLPGLTGIEDKYVLVKNKKLRCGYTTGTCAAAAAKAAVWMLLSGRTCYWTDLLTPKGIRLHLPLEEQEIVQPGFCGGPEKFAEGECSERQYARCAVRKYAGDDPDATDGILIFAQAERLPGDCETADRAGRKRQILIDGGVGVGRVEKPGLEQPVGEAAINRVPREMITREAEAVCEEFKYPGRLKITISVPEGAGIARRTFNPHLGIQGGISILGTSGIVMPMSEDALIASIRVEMKQKAALGEQYILITPGNYGADFVRKGACGPDMNTVSDRSIRLQALVSMKCSNYVGETLDIAEELGVKGILFVAHIGKFIKVSGGIMNTHSAHADCRAELIAAQAMRAGTPPEIVKKLLATNTTEEAVGILTEAGWIHQTMAEVTARIKLHLQKHCKGALETEAILFSNQYGYLGETDGADAMIEKMTVSQT